MSAITYKKSGVDIKEADRFVTAIAGDLKKTLNSSVLRRKGSFGGLYDLTKSKMRKPVLVSSTDGVGTKLLIAQKFNKHDTVGIDLVAMNVNDILCTGAKPLFFLDYIACGKLNSATLKKVVRGIVKGCQQSQSSLIAGETAEMPDMYKRDEYDLAGFAVGIVEKSKIIDGSKIRKGDKLIGFPSTGLHSNGYSLVRKVFSTSEQRKCLAQILAPTKIYTKEVSALINNFQVNGLAHITGGAYFDKLTKILPKGKCFVIDKRNWPKPKIFQLLQKKGKIAEHEMYQTFNMGIGMTAVVRERDAKKISSYLKRRKIRHYLMGEVINDSKRKIIL